MIHSFKISKGAKLLAPFFLCARQGAFLGGERLLLTRSGEELAEDKGVHREMESEGSPYGKTLHRGTRSAYEAVHQGKAAKIAISPKLIRDAWIVYATVVSVKEKRMYPGRSHFAYESTR